MRIRLFLIALACLALTSCELYDRLTRIEELAEAKASREAYERYRDSGIGVKRD